MTVSEQANGAYMLEISSISRMQRGKYTVKLSNAAGSVETSCNVTVNVPPTIIKQIENVSCTEGSECHFMIEVEGHPQPTIEWFKDGQKVRADKRISTRLEE